MFPITAHQKPQTPPPSLSSLLPLSVFLAHSLSLSTRCKWIRNPSKTLKICFEKFLNRALRNSDGEFFHRNFRWNFLWIPTGFRRNFRRKNSPSECLTFSDGSLRHRFFRRRSTSFLLLIDIFCPLNSAVNIFLSLEQFQ